MLIGNVTIVLKNNLELRLVERYPFSTRIIVWLVLPLLLLIVGAFAVLSKSLPLKAGSLEVPGLKAQVSVSRDAHGVPHIRANSDLDAFYALGFVHAQERMWQMDFKRRLGQGRLSELTGAEALGTDKLMRTLGLAHAAEQALASLNKDERDVLAAYARGVNAWIDQSTVLPPEFLIFGVRPDHWKQSDSLLMIKLLALNLGANFRDELGQQILVKHLGKPAVSELNDKVESNRVSHKAAEALSALQDKLQAEHGIGGVGIGSNAWVVAGRHTSSGMPILAGDPHLAHQIPSLFFLANLDGDRLHVSGATVPGVPVVIFGRNRSVAWSGTNLAADVQDIYIEQLAPDGEGTFLRNGKWQALDVRHEQIRVAPPFPAFMRDGYKLLPWRVRATSAGPLISDAVGDKEQPFALRWTALDADDTTYASMLAVNYAGSVEQTREALGKFVAPALSFVVADRSGNIALLAAGRIPLREGYRGTEPVAAADQQFAWKRYLRPEELPAIVNPPSGWIVSANQQIHPNTYPYLISNNWQPPYRAQRIGSMLAAATANGAKVNAEQMRSMQRDVLETESQGLLPLMVRQAGSTEVQRETLAILRKWDGRMAADSVGAAIYFSWSRHLVKRLMEEPLKVDLAQPQRLSRLHELAREYRPAFMAKIATGELAHWCKPGVGADGTRACDQVALLALDDAITELRRLAGHSVSGWQWGEVHGSLYPHQPFNLNPLLSRVFDRHGAGGGGRYTVDVAGTDFDPDRGYVKRMGAVYRAVISLESADAGAFSIDTGQSGNILDAHYDDLIARHRAGTLLPMHGAAEKTLHLLPATHIGGAK